MNKTLISVVIPVFNADKYIISQLDIIKRQGFDDIEVLFVDNNSNDNSVQTIQSCIHSKSYAFPIQLLSEKKQGAGAARNRGLKVARGKYITFLDVDDEILEGKWKKDLSILRENDKLDYVFCRAKRVYEDGRTILHDIDGIKEGLNLPSGLSFIWAGHFFKIQNTSSTILKTGLARQINGFEESVMIGEDAMFFIKLGYYGTGYFYNEVYFNYFKRNTSTTVKRNKERSSNLDNYILKKTCIIPFFESQLEIGVVENLRNNQFYILRLLYLEGIYNWDELLIQLNEVGVTTHFAIKTDLLLIKYLGIAIPYKYNLLLRFLAKI